MKTHARVAVIGGGVVGCSVLYHLTKAGWSDVVLFERDELTSGSTWHAAGGMHSLNSDPNVAKLQDYTIRLYKEIEEISGQSCGIHLPGGIMIAGTPDRMDFLAKARAIGRNLGLEVELITAREAGEIHPLIDTKHFLGALWDPNEGHIDPSGVTNAYAKSARIGGAKIYRFTKVEGLEPTASGAWWVVTDKGVLEAEHVVNASGLWAREVGRMVGIELPVLAMQHQYIVTEFLPEIEAHGSEIPHAIDFEAEIYTRQEGQGLLLGTYEQACLPWSERVTPWDFGHELLPPDLDRIAPSLEVGFEHFPAAAKAGIKRVINGPFTFAPDGNPLVGPVRGLPGFWCACGVMAGFSQGGGVGLSLANWITEGDPGMDIFAMDVARFGDYATTGYTNAKVQENYRRRFSITFPNEELPAARPLRTTPIYDRLKGQNAVFGASCGLEHPLWFAPQGQEPWEQPTFRRSNAFGPVGEECRAVREGVGIVETSGFAKYEVTGPGAEAWLSRILAGRIPDRGRMVLTPMLNPRGGIIGDFTLTRLAEDRFMLFGSGQAENFHMRWFESHLPKSGVTLRALGTGLVGLSVAGPQSRALLTGLAAEDMTTDSFPFLSFRRMDIGMVPALVGRVTYTGDLGYEIWVAPDRQRALYDLLMDAGAELGIRPFGARALHSLRLENSFGAFTREYRPDYLPGEAGLGRFLDWARDGFIGRDAALKERESGPARRLVTFVVDAGDADATGDEPLWHDGKVVGWATSGGYGHTVRESLALGYIPAPLAEAEDFDIEILGERRFARRVSASPFDPKGERMRG
jgi:dimethylglycine dehydrogenase